MQVRIYYDKSSGRVDQVEHRLDEHYTKENALKDDGLAMVVVDGSGLEGVPLHELEVKRGKLARPAEPASAAGAVVDEQGTSVHPEAQTDDDVRRIDELARLDKSDMSDEEWLKLFREYTTLTGGF